MKITKSRLRQIIKEELENSMLDADPGGGLSASELRDIADDLDSNDAEVESSDAEIIEPYVMRNIRDTNKRAFENNSSNDVLFLGVSPQHIYFKTMDDAYYRIPR